MKPATRRGGVKCISGLIYEKTCSVLKVFLKNVFRDAVAYTEHAKRKTLCMPEALGTCSGRSRRLNESWFEIINVINGPFQGH